MTTLTDSTGQFDIERYLKDIEEIFKQNLTTELGIIDTEKGDFTLDTIPDDAFYMNSIPATFSYDTFVVWGIESQDTVDSTGFATLQTVSVFIEVASVEGGESDTETLIYRLLRYSRALKSVLHKNHRALRGNARLEVRDLRPAASIIRGESVFSAGISIKATFDS